MTSVGALLRYLKKKEVDGELTIEGNTYSSSQIRLAEQLLGDVAKEYDKAIKKPKLSRRRAFIVVLEEEYYNVSEYPQGLTMEDIHKKAFQRFDFSQRSMRTFTSPTEVHPKDPCSHYENDGLRKAKYRQSLAHLVTFSKLYFKVREAELSLENTYKEILLC